MHEKNPRLSSCIWVGGDDIKSRGEPMLQLKTIKGIIISYTKLHFEELDTLVSVFKEDKFCDTVIGSQVMVERMSQATQQIVELLFETTDDISALADSRKLSQTMCLYGMFKICTGTIIKMISARTIGAAKTIWSLLKFKIEENLDILSKFFWIH